MTMTTSAKQIYETLLAAEVDGSNAPDMRRVLSAARQTLHVAMQRGDAASIQAAAEEGARVARMWGVDI